MQKVQNNGVEYYVIDRLSDIQNQMLKLLGIVDSICKDNNLPYFLDGGTAIGAYRHGGFVPWDDDLDISLLKPDYLKLVEILKSLDRSQYFLFDYDYSIQCCAYFGEYVPFLSSADQKKRHIRPIKIDIRPLNIIENNPDSIEENQKLRKLANYLIFNEVDSNELDEIMELYVRKFQSDRKAFFRYYNLEYGVCNATDDVVLAHPYLKYSSPNTYKMDDILPLKPIKFQSVDSFVPASDILLTDVYGDYMSFPNLESRKPEAECLFDAKHNKALYKYLINKDKKNVVQKTIFALRANLYCK